MRYIFILLLTTQMVFSQTETFGIDTTYDSSRQECQPFNQILSSKPKEVKFGIRRDGNQLYLSATDEGFIKKLLSGRQDGLAIDVVSKSRYDCEESPEETQLRGQLLKPVYARTFTRRYDDKKKRFTTPVGTVPSSMQNDDLEYNIVFFKDNKMCMYNTLYDLESYPWELMDMGLYLDEVVYKNDLKDSEEKVERLKTLQFIVPFEKNKTNYDTPDIKPIYDSLHLTEFNIKKIKIKAYASVEGSTENNLELQKGRAESIVRALQSFQTDNIETQIETAENWVEFLDDVQRTEYASLASKPKKKIKQSLTGNTSRELEPILSKHRKAVVTLQMHKIDLLRNKSTDELVVDFNNAIRSDDLEQARKVYFTLADKILLNQEPQVLDKLELPLQKKYVPFNASTKSMEFWFEPRQALIVKKALNQMEKLDPQNKKIKYNKVVIDMMLLRSNAGNVTEKGLANDIKALKKFGIADPYIKRFLVNLNLLRAERHMRKRNYDQKDKAVSNIWKLYKNAALSDADYVSLAQYLTYYDSTDRAVRLLEPIATTLTADENILFYFLNLTIIDSNRTQEPDYRTVMQNAIDKNKARFCKIFDPSLGDGVTFQLLEDDYLRSTYCETCTD